MFALSQHPSVYSKVQREIDENVFGAMPSQKELENLKYLDQVIFLRNANANENERTTVISDFKSISKLFEVW